MAWAIYVGRDSEELRPVVTVTSLDKAVRRAEKTKAKLEGSRGTARLQILIREEGPSLRRA